MSERVEVQRTIPADPATIFAIVSSPTGHVAIDATGMLQGGSGDPAHAVDEQWNHGDGTWPIVPEFALKATLGILDRTVAPTT